MNTRGTRERLLTVLKLLLDKPYSTRELADMYLQLSGEEVGGRTIFEDIKAIEREFPIITETVDSVPRYSIGVSPRVRKVRTSVMQWEKALIAESTPDQARKLRRFFNMTIDEKQAYINQYNEKHGTYYSYGTFRGAVMERVIRL